MEIFKGIWQNVAGYDEKQCRVVRMSKQINCCSWQTRTCISAWVKQESIGAALILVLLFTYVCASHSNVRRMGSTAAIWDPFHDLRVLNSIIGTSCSRTGEVSVHKGIQ